MFYKSFGILIDIKSLLVYLKAGLSISWNDNDMIVISCGEINAQRIYWEIVMEFSFHPQICAYQKLIRFHEIISRRDLNNYGHLQTLAFFIRIFLNEN